jgi:hypothetical protein
LSNALECFSFLKLFSFSTEAGPWELGWSGNPVSQWWDPGGVLRHAISSSSIRDLYEVVLVDMCADVSGNVMR